MERTTTKFSRTSRIRPRNGFVQSTRCTPWLLLGLILLLPPCQDQQNSPTCWLAEARPPPPPPRAPTPPAPAVDRRRTTATTTTTHPTTKESATPATQQVLQVVETEVWNGQRWIGPDPHTPSWPTGDTDISRWTLAATGQACVSPAQLQPPEGTAFDGDWKIVTTTSGTTSSTGSANTRDAYGWEYHWEKSYAKRQRIWLRSLEPITTVAATPAATTTTAKRIATTHTIRPLAELLLQSVARSTVLIPQILRAVRDDWNFKGFGISLYKSFLFKYSCGAALRIPLSTNWDTWDRHPEWPSISAVVALYYPPCLYGGISCSCNVEWVKWVVRRTLITLRHVIAWTLLMLARGFLTAGSALAYPVTRQLYLVSDEYWNQLLPSLRATEAVAAPRPSFSGTLQERLGLSVSWRVSQSRGYEFRVGYWHLYLPTILSLIEHIDHVQQQVRQSYVKTKTAVMGATRGKRKPVSVLVAANEKKLDSNESETDDEVDSSNDDRDVVQDFSLVEQSRNFKWSDWLLQKKVGSLGISTGYPIPDHPFFSCSSVLSMSGFYFRTLSTATSSSSSGATLLATNSMTTTSASRKTVNTVTTSSSEDAASRIGKSLVGSSGTGNNLTEEDGDMGLNEGSTKKRKV